MRRLAVLGLGLWACTCVGTNPDWDDPTASSAASTTIAVQATDTAQTDATGSATAAATDGTVTTAMSGDASTSVTGASDAGSSDTTSSSSGEESCDDGWARCDGACVNIDKDPLHCGAACLDCRIEFGDEAECRHGECREGDEGKGD